MPIDTVIVRLVLTVSHIRNEDAVRHVALPSLLSGVSNVQKRALNVTLCKAFSVEVSVSTITIFSKLDFI